MQPPRAGPLIHQPNALPEPIQATGHCALERARRFVSKVSFANGKTFWICLKCGSKKISMISDVDPNQIPIHSSPLHSVRDYPRVALDWSCCHYCGQKFQWKDKRLNPTRDHIIPRALGGQDALTNLVAACRRCNEKKADKWPTCTCPKCMNAIAMYRWNN